MAANALVRRRSTELGLIDRMPTTALRIVPPVGIRRTVLAMVIFGFGIFGGLGVWASLAPMQSAVVASGVFRVIGDRVGVQHFEGGIVKEIFVKEGSVVTAGQPLIALDDTAARANVDILQNQLVSALSTQARLQAEFNNDPDMQISPELAALLGSNPSFAAMVDTQRDVLNSNSQISRGQVDILQERIAQLQKQKEGLDARQASQEDQIALIREEIAAKTALLAKGLSTKSELVSMRRDEATLEGNIGVTQSQLQSTFDQIAEVEARKLQVRHDNLKEITEGRQAVNEQIFELRQQLAGAQDVVDRLTIRASRPGRVVDLKVNTLGRVIAPGEELMEIVPDDAGFVIEVKVSPNDVNQVKEGGKARVRLTAYNYRTTPLVEGVVTAVSADSLSDKSTGAAYFQADVRINDGQLDALKGVEVVAGMPAQVMIATGSQTLADYLLSPVISAYDHALTENE